MKKLVISTIMTVGVFCTGTSNAAMDPMIESALQDICYSSITDRTYAFKKVVKQYNLDMKKVANRVVCDGEDIGTFAAENGAAGTANLIRSYQQGHVEVTDLAIARVPTF